ncbi:DVU3141 family protein [Oceanimonas sp. CAM02]|uniref:DVU3141 family protein n=1 Tax=Oceanimonas sp. CAM02 TaxID=3080336 RepID=UPI002935566E|nr:DVU3141 family protein [Oceanimonas sp. CAM02]MDV2857248.1 DVU3141 family protein [Oceanimonas sp. CAM02]
MSLIRTPLAGTLVALCLTLAGCASQHTATTSANSTPLNEFLSNAASHSATQLATSPWGPNVQITAGATYFAASGKTCRPLQITLPAGSQQEQIACQAKNGEWQLSRSL